jgi:phosphatidylethanolamine/phosphatidyl-N-methylethanolamine N-methyltransferase
MVRDRKSVGAIAPSGRFLADAIVRALGDVPKKSLIIELGPGTGVFTKRLMQRHPQATTLAIEIDRALVQNLKRKIPRATVINGCATRIRELISKHKLDHLPVAGVVSGLPLLSLPKNLPTDILAEIAAVLPEGKPYVQFTYSRMAWKRFTPQGLRYRKSKLVMTNIPPASVLSFEKDGQQAAESIRHQQKGFLSKLRRQRMRA